LLMTSAAMAQTGEDSLPRLSPSGESDTSLSFPMRIQPDPRPWKLAPVDAVTLRLSGPINPQDSIVFELELQSSASGQVFLRSRGAEGMTRHLGARTLPGNGETTTVRVLLEGN